MLTQSELLGQGYLLCLFTPSGSLHFGMESGHDFPDNILAAITARFYAAAADCRFGNQKVKIRERHFTKLYKF